MFDILITYSKNSRSNTYSSDILLIGFVVIFEQDEQLTRVKNRA